MRVEEGEEAQGPEPGARSPEPGAQSPEPWALGSGLWALGCFHGFSIGIRTAFPHSVQLPS